jgi:hypothetical protein
VRAIDSFNWLGVYDTLDCSHYQMKTDTDHECISRDIRIIELLNLATDDAIRFVPKHKEVTGDAASSCHE